MYSIYCRYCSKSKAKKKNNASKLGIPLSWDASIFRTFFPAYTQNPIEPYDAITTIQNKNMPICIILSQQDKKVPYEHALYLYKEYKKCEFNNCHLVTIPDGKHSFLLQDEKVKNFYLQEMHSFYKKHYIEYDTSYGKTTIASKQPTDDEIAKQIKEYQIYLEEKLAVTQKMLLSSL